MSPQTGLACCSFSKSTTGNYAKINPVNVKTNKRPMTYFNHRPVIMEKNHHFLWPTIKSDNSSDPIKHLICEKIEKFIKSNIYSNTIDEIQKLKYLEANWDSYGAPIPNAASFKNAKMMAQFISSKSLRPARVTPSVEGGINFLFINNTKYATLECDNDNNIIAGMSDRISEPIVWEVKTTQNELRDTIDKIAEFIL